VVLGEVVGVEAPLVRELDQLQAMSVSVGKRAPGVVEPVEDAEAQGQVIMVAWRVDPRRHPRTFTRPAAS
jgi:hypothetical protein